MALDLAEAAAPQPPFREARLLPVDLMAERRTDGTVLLASRVPLRAYEANIPAAFAARAAALADKPALAKRDASGVWRDTTYGALKRDMDAATQWLLDHAPPGRPVMILASNTPAFAVMSFAAQASGRAACPVSPTYAALGGDYARLAHVIAKVRPGVIFAEDARAVGPALARVDLGDARVVVGDPAASPVPATAYADLLETAPTEAVAQSIALISPGDVAVYMLTSGSTGLPKVVPITFDNLAANSAQCQQTVGEAAGWHDVMLDWLPWHHAAGAFVLRTTLLEGGLLYIDDGKPAPGLFEESIRNLGEISVSYYNNVPLGYAMLVDALERDPALAATFFEKMRLMLYGGAGLSQSLSDRLQAVAVRETGRRVMMTSGYGMTETVSAFMVIHFETDRVGIGLPTPGAQVKLVPEGARYELRVKGPQVMGGYLDEPAKTATAFDEEGYYRTGDLVVFHDPDDPVQGLAFAGRAAEEFKLANGNWVYGGAVREALLRALSPLVTEVVLCDDGRPFLAALAWGQPGADHEELAARLRAYNAGQHGGGAQVRRLLLLDRAPDPNASELSDKGTVNRRAVIDGRADAVAALYAEAPPAEVVLG